MDLHCTLYIGVVAFYAWPWPEIEQRQAVS
jgi:hypothetical protein